MQGKVVKVKDGDMVVIAPRESDHFIICRLYGVDAPETAKRGAPYRMILPGKLRTVVKLPFHPVLRLIPLPEIVVAQVGLRFSA